MSSVNFQRTYVLGEAYESVKEDAIQVLGKYLRYPDLIMFDDLNRSVTFSTERLIPAVSSNRPRVMLLFSNPHPHSVYQGMFLSPNTRGLANPFWSVMRDAGWLSFSEGKRNPKELADICMTAEYQGPFELVFYCYYAFPTGLPEDIRRIFGDEYFSQSIKPEAVHEFVNTVQETAVDAVVAFNKEVFNLVSRRPSWALCRTPDGRRTDSEPDWGHRSTRSHLLNFSNGLAISQTIQTTPFGQS